MSDHQRPFKLVQSTRGGYKLSENGFFYKQRIVGETINWQCEQRGNCRARIFTKDYNKLSNYTLFYLIAFSIVFRLTTPYKF